MDRVVFYHNVRKDRGERTGLSVIHRGEFTKGFDFFEPGKGETNPIIDWAFDVTANTKSAPKTVSQAKTWLRQNVEVISESLQEAANELKSGLDADGVPWHFERTSSIGMVRVTINATATNTGKEIAKHLLNFVRIKLNPTLEKMNRVESIAVACA